jgi:predicted DNA-binding transcriptional regulator YafY
LLRACGFDLNRDAFNRFYILSRKETGVHFTNEEAAYLKQLILVAGNQHALKDAVLNKVVRASDIALAAGHLVHAKNGLTVERLAQAIANREQVLLKRYHSIHSETITDRLVEPFGFTENYHMLMAFEVESKRNKTFHIDRITEVTFCAKTFSFEELHEQQIPDAFGFSARADGKKFPVDAKLSLKGFLLLKNEYPMALPFVKHNAQQNVYELKMEVNNLAPVERFLKGLD